MTKKNTTSTLAAIALLAGAVVAQNASAQSPGTQAEPSGVLSLAAQASEDVPQDVVDITLFYEQEAKDAGSLTSVLNQRADAALRMAKGVDNVTAHSGAFTVYPSTDRDGRISAWRGRTEVVLESKDFTAATKLASKMSDAMQVGSVTFSLSPESQREAEQKLSTRAIASFKQQAQASSQAFGYSGYAIREVNIGHNGSSPRPVMMMAARSMNADAKMAAPMALEAGTSTVTVSVSGSVQMNR
jgi:predicted secreted protein